ncbi:AroM family protein [Promicromonospora sp. Marseille-Q5078]
MGFLTIGQAPRPDLSGAIEAALPPGVATRHAGALDEVDRATAERLYGAVAGRPTLITKLADGQSITLDADAVSSGLQERLTELEDAGCDVVVVLCTGEFPGLRARRARLIEPDALITTYVSTMLAGAPVGVVVPLPEQVAEARDKWGRLDPAPLFATGSPYADDTTGLVAAAHDLVGAGAQAVVLDCMGYADRHRDAVRAGGVAVPVLTSGAITGAWTGLLLG